MNETQPKIKFASNPIYSFYGLWCDCVQNPDASKDVLRDFKDERLSKITDILPKKGAKTYSMMGAVHQNNITNINELQSIMRENFNAQDLQAISKIWGTAFEAYKDFYTENKENIDNNLAVMNSEQQNYQKELANLYKSFSTPPEIVCTCYLNPFPEKKFGDGISNDKSISMDYSLSKTEDINNYIDHSDILKRKRSTPFHESTHFLFNNSQLKKDIEKENSPGIKSVLNHVISQFEKKGNGTASREDIKPFAIGAINEAFAACSTALYNEKTTGKPVCNDNVWYYGWKEANDLTRQMYPHFKEYVNEGKPFDERFFKKLNISIKIDELRNSNESQSIERSAPNRFSKLRGLNPISESKAPYKAKDISKADFNTLKLYKDKKTIKSVR